jgi:AcrR family transcriptional regulator
MSAPKVRTRLDPEVRREQIVDAAGQVLARRPPAEVTFEEIADEAGISRALVYNYFGDRAALLAAVYLRSFDQLDQDLAAALDAAHAPVDQVADVVHCYVRFARANAPAWRQLPLAGTIDHPSIEGARRRRLARLADAWGGTPEARIVAVGIAGLLEAVTVDWVDAGAVDSDELAALLVTLVWSGLSSLTP